MYLFLLHSLHCHLGILFINTCFADCTEKHHLQKGQLQKPIHLQSCGSIRMKCNIINRVHL